MHAYWQLDRPLPALGVDADTGEVLEPIEHANARLAAHLGADSKCVDRNRLLRVAGSPNHKRGRWARIVDADLAMSPYPITELVGRLADNRHQTRSPRPASPLDSDDPYKQIPAADYMPKLAGRTPDRHGKVRCPAREHP
ncbi:MAG: hypothetical protein ABSG43_22585, partial [Solirubrobacteraceae bacterium]